MCIAINLCEYYDLLQNMQCRDSLGPTTKIPRLSKGSTRKLKTRFSSSSDVFADKESPKGQADLSVNGMRLRSEKTSMAVKGEVSRPDRRARRFWTLLTKGNKRSSGPTLSQVRTSNGKKSKGRKRPRSFPRSSRGEEVLFRGMSKSETKTHKWRKKTIISDQAEQIAMMSSISPSEEQTGSKAKKSWKSLYDERIASLRTGGLSSSYDHPEITHPDVDFTPCPRNDMSRKAHV